MFEGRINYHVTLDLKYITKFENPKLIYIIYSHFQSTIDSVFI